jgi:FtsH-binding integral membrane protein
MDMHTYAPSAAQASVEDRSAFLVRTYVHLVGAVFAFVLLETMLFASGVADTIAAATLGAGQMGWLLVLGAFMGASWLANRWAHSGASAGTQYAGLGLYVVAQALIFVPLLYMAIHYAGDGVLATAALTTLVLFGGLTGVVFITRKDFSFLRGVIMLGGFAAMGLIVVSAIAGFTLGNLFCWAMIALASGSVLYNTSNVLHHYRTDQHVAASLGLFAAVALMFWYVLRLLLSRR